MNRRVLVTAVLAGAVGVVFVTFATAATARHSAPQRVSATTATTRLEKLARLKRLVAPPSSVEATALVGLAKQVAAADGEPNPHAIRAVGTTRGAANFLDTGAMVDSNQDVYMVTMAGDFKAAFASPPPGVPRPTGTVLTFVYDPATQAITDMSVGPISPDLSQLGQVETLSS